MEGNDLWEAIKNEFNIINTIMVGKIYEISI